MKMPPKKKGTGGQMQRGVNRKKKAAMPKTKRKAKPPIKFTKRTRVA